jgi:CMP-N,N'-diacetyllegionaminic acid synthase
MKNSVLGIIPARGGSKGLPGKNLKLLAGIPLIQHSIRAAQGCPMVGKLVVSTEDQSIKQAALQLGVEVVDRPPEFAQDHSGSQEVVRHALQSADPNHQYSTFVLLQPTSPLRTRNHLSQCLELHFAKKSRCTISVCLEKHPPQRSLVLREGLLQPFLGTESLNVPRQTLEPVYRQNGALYVMDRDLFLSTDKFYVPPVLPYVMDERSSLDIDDADDLELAEWYLSHRK